MLVVISDLHLTDGSSGETIKAGAFRAFVENLRQSVEDACWRENDEFRPIERCDLVLLGDILDVIRSSQWLTSAEDVRPWTEGPALGPLVDRITEAILQHNDRALRFLRDLGGVVRVRDPGGAELAIPLGIHYFVGNHDWFYHLRGPDYDRARSRIVSALGLANSATEPFPHVLTEASSALQQRFQEHRVYAQHGDVHDEFNFERTRGRDYSSLGDCIVIELLNRFPWDVARQLGLATDDPDVRLLRELDNVRPVLAVPNWVDGVLRRSARSTLRKEVTRVWDEQVTRFLDMPFVRSLDAWGWDKVDALELALRLSGGLSIRMLSSLSGRIKRLKEGDDYTPYALAEDAIRRGISDFVVYGHTHFAETVPLDLFPNNAGQREQLYFNSGTWRRVHQRCARELDSLEFASFDAMTFLIFYAAGERAGRRYETWTGQLA